MSVLKRFFKRNSHNLVFKNLAGFGRALNRLYENRNHDLESNGESELLRKLSSLNPRTIIDGGANVGRYSTYASKICPRARIYAFEPVGDTFQKLKQNVGNIKNIIPINQGFYKEHTFKEINVYQSDTHSSLYDVYEGRKSESVTIELIKGDDFLKSESIDFVDFLKLDLEGAEYDALLGFRQSLETGKIRIIQFEYGYINIVTRKLLIDFYEMLGSLGYRVGKLFPKAVEFRQYEFKYEDFIGPNFIAIREDDEQLKRLLETK